MKTKSPISQGPKGDLDSRRWIIITIRNNGAQEAQFPLPVTVNTQRIAFDRDEPVIAPAYYLDTLDNCVLPKYEEIPKSAREPGNDDQARLVELKYTAEISEIDDKYQTTDGIMEFARLLRYNYEWSNEMQAKLKPKPQRKTSGATANAN